MNNAEHWALTIVGAVIAFLLLAYFFSKAVKITKSMAKTPANEKQVPAPANSNPVDRAVDILKRTPLITIAGAVMAIIILIIIAWQYGPAVKAFLAP